MIVLSSLRQQLCYDAVCWQGTVHRATTCALVLLEEMGAAQQWQIADGWPSQAWMQSMHHRAQHARAATAVLMAAAEALCTQGGCTLVHRTR